MLPSWAGGRTSRAPTATTTRAETRQACPPFSIMAERCMHRSSTCVLMVAAMVCVQESQHTAHGAGHASAVTGMRSHMPHNSLPSLYQSPCALSTCCVLQGLTEVQERSHLGCRASKGRNNGCVKEQIRRRGTVGMAYKETVWHIVALENLLI